MNNLIKTENTMQQDNGANYLVQGFHHHLTFENGFRVYGWTPNQIIRKEAVKQLLSFANAGTEDFDENGNTTVAYDKSVIDSYWTTKKY